MASKEIVTFEIDVPSHNYTAQIQVGVAVGDEEGPGLAVIGSVHGTEYAAQEGTLEFGYEIDPASLKGSVRVVLYADSAALEGHSAYVNPLDGKNLNRGWPGKPDATLTERIAHKITTEFIERSDAVIDVHGGEWDEDIDCFIITHRTGDATRRAILDAAHHLFLEKGYAATSIEAIAEHAQVARQTVYDAFGDRTSLLYAVAERVVA